MTPDPDLQRRIDEAVGYLIETIGPVPPNRYAAALAYVAQAVTHELGVPIVVTWTPYGVVGYPMPSVPPPT